MNEGLESSRAALFTRRGRVGNDRLGACGGDGVVPYRDWQRCAPTCADHGGSARPSSDGAGAGQRTRPQPVATAAAADRPHVDQSARPASGIPRRRHPDRGRGLSQPAGQLPHLHPGVPGAGTRGGAGCLSPGNRRNTVLAAARRHRLPHQSRQRRGAFRRPALRGGRGQQFRDRTTPGPCHQRKSTVGAVLQQSCSATDVPARSAQRTGPRRPCNRTGPHLLQYLEQHRRVTAAQRRRGRR